MGKRVDAWREAKRRARASGERVDRRRRWKVSQMKVFLMLTMQEGCERGEFVLLDDGRYAIAASEAHNVE